MDLIDRQQAIDAINCDITVTGRQNAELVAATIGTFVDRIKALPSAQPFEIQEILDYLDTKLHPIISPEHWNIYSELHDMISTLPSAQPERKKGKWINKDGGLATCSACGERWGVWSVMNYCPNCGADMRGEQE